MEPTFGDLYRFKFGFVKDGEEFLEDGIPHTPMALTRSRMRN